MMTWLMGIFQKVFLEFIWGKLSTAFSSLLKRMAVVKKSGKIEEDNLKQAEVVDELAKQVSALLRAGADVPLELQERLRNEARKLNLNNNIGN